MDSQLNREATIQKILELEAVKKEMDARKFTKDLFLFNKEVLKVEGKDNQNPLSDFHHEMCDFVMSKSKKKLVLVPRGHLKSTLITIGYSLMRIAQDPSVRILIANATYDMATSFLGQIKKHLQNNETFRDYYGDLAKNASRWSENMISVPQLKPFEKKEATVTTYGVGGNLVSQHYDCLLPGTEILTSNGYEKVENVHKGNRVLSSDGKFRSVVATQKKRTDKMIVGISPSYQSKTTTVTSDHQVYIWRNNSFQWIEAGNLTMKDMLVVPRCTSRNGGLSRTNKRINYLYHQKDIWRLMGYWLAEGCNTKGGAQIRLTFSYKESLLVEDVKRIVTKYLKVPVSARNTNSSTIIVCFSDKEMKEILSKFGTMAINKIIPPFVLNNSTVRQVELVRGYFAGDGSHNEKSVAFSSSSYSLLSGIQLILAKLGIQSGISQGRSEGESVILGNKVHIRDSWNLTSTNTDLRNMLGLSSKYSFKPRRSWFHKDYWIVPIRRLEYQSKWDGFVYDIQVEGTHDFYCPGMIVHNCIIMDDVVNRDLVSSPEQIQKTILFYKDALDLLEPTGTLIIIGTRWSDSDLYGWILDKTNPERAFEDFDLFFRQAYKGNLETGADLEMLYPQKFTQEIIEGLKRSKGPLEFAAQYMNDPMPAEEAKFKPQWFKQVLEDELKWREMSYFTMVDPAIGQLKDSDRTAIVTIGVDQFNNWFIVNVIWEKLLPSDTINYIFANWERFQPRQIGIEMVSFQKSLQYALHDEMRRRNIYLPIVELKASRSKEERIEGLIPRYANGSIYHLTQCPFRDELEEELMRFPRGKHDDVIDALAYGLQIAHQARTHKPVFDREGGDSEDRVNKFLY